MAIMFRFICSQEYLHPALKFNRPSRLISAINDTKAALKNIGERRKKKETILARQKETLKTMKDVLARLVEQVRYKSSPRTTLAFLANLLAFCFPNMLSYPCH